MQTLEVMAAHGEGFNDLNPNAVALVNQYYNNDLYRDRLEADLFQLTESEQSRLQTEQIAELVMAGAGLGAAAVKSGPGIVSWVKGLFGAKKPNAFPVPESLPTNIHMGQQGKHIKGHNNFEEGRSYFYNDVDPKELLAGVHSNKYSVVAFGARGNPIVEFGRPIGVDGRTRKAVTRGQIHYGKNGAHIVPDSRN